LTVSSLLYELQPPNGQPLRWLFGSMHIRDNRVYQFGEKLYPLIRQADVFVGEMELDHPSGSPFAMPYHMKMHITAPAFEKMRKQFLKSFQVDIERYVHVHPMIALSAISQSVLSAEHQVSLDEHLWHFAQEQGKATMGLESYLEQATLLHSIAPGDLYKQLLKISRSPSTINRQTQRALNSYMKSDIHQLYHLTRSSMRGLRRKIIYDRNKVMAKRMLDFSPHKKYFIVAGAGHLSGKFGLLALLKQSDWKAKPIQLLSDS